jgi:hypothetical protein
LFSFGFRRCKTKIIKKLKSTKNPKDALAAPVPNQRRVGSLNKHPAHRLIATLWLNLQVYGIIVFLKGDNDSKTSINKMKAKLTVLYVVSMIALFTTSEAKCQILITGGVSTSEVVKFDSLMANLSEYSSSRNRAYFDAILKNTKTNGWKQKRIFNQIVSIGNDMSDSLIQKMLAKIPSNDIYYTRATAVLTGYGVRNLRRLNLEGEIGQHVLTTQVLNRKYLEVWDNREHKIPSNIQFIAHLANAIQELEKKNKRKSVAYFEKADSLIVGSWQKMYYSKVKAIATVIESHDKTIPAWYKIGLDTMMLDGNLYFHSADHYKERHKMISHYADIENKEAYLGYLLKLGMVTLADTTLIRTVTEGYDFTLITQLSANKAQASVLNAEQRILEADIKIKRYASILPILWTIAAISFIGMIILYILLRVNKKRFGQEIQGAVDAYTVNVSLLANICEKKLKETES